MAKRMAYGFGTGVNLKLFNEKHPYVLPMAAASRTMKPFFLENAPLGQSIHLFDNQVHERDRLRLVGAPVSTNSALAYQTQISHRRQQIMATRQLTPLQFIAQLETHLSRLVSETRIDNFGITAISHHILKRIRAALIAETDYPGSKQLRTWLAWL